MSQNLPDNYQENVPDDVDMTQSEWEELGYHGQYHHAERNKERFERIRNKRKQKKKNWIDRIKAEKGCKNCGLDNPVCLVYHHLGNKSFSLGGAAYRDIAKDKIKKELNKCVVLCANCHRRHHAGEIDIDRNT